MRNASLRIITVIMFLALCSFMNAPSVLAQGGIIISPVDIHFEVVDPALPTVTNVQQMTFFGDEYRNTSDVDGSGNISAGDTSQIDGVFAITSFISNGFIVVPPGFGSTWEITGTYVGLQDITIPVTVPGTINYVVTPNIGIVTLYVSTDMTQPATALTGLGYDDGTVVAQYLVSSGGGVYRTIASFDGARDMDLLKQSSLAGLFVPDVQAAVFDSNLDADSNNNGIGGDFPIPSSWQYPVATPEVNFPWSYYVFTDGSMRFGTPECGNGEIDPGETCDPPGSLPADGAGNECRNGGSDYQCTYCGDGIKQEGAGEECDFNDPDAPENCNTDCELEPICGDGNVDIDLGETCDPPTGYCTGATLPRTPCITDGDCPAGETCGLPVAPAGGGDADRTCRNGDGSPDECTYCGDGIENNGEECDDGNDNNDDGCTNDCMIVMNPDIDIEKVTNSVDNQNTTPPNFDNEDDANGPGVPVIPAGSDITWTYKVTNTGDVAFAKADVVVQDSVAAVDATLVLVDDADGDDILSPGEMWFYEATGTALDLLNPQDPLPDGVNIVEGCSNSFGDPQPPTATYMNTATVTADGLEDSDDSHYCGPPPECEVMVTKTCVAPPPGDGNDGCTPGYWKQTQHFVSWVGYSQDDDFETVFGVDASFTTTLLGAMEQGGGDEIALGRHAVAALLSASNPNVEYFTDVAGVIAIVQGAYATGNFESAKNLLDFQNNQGCPLNSDSDTNGDGDNGSATAQLIEADECEVVAGTAVTYNYEIENTGSVNLSTIEVIDDPDPGDPFEVPGSPVQDLAPDEIVTLMSQSVIDETTTNTVTVTGNPGPDQCTAMDTVTVMVIDVGEGCTPGYWKQSQHFGSWVGFDQNDDFETVFGVDATTSKTLLEALEKGGGDEDALGRHAVAALLNASNPDVDYFTDVAGVIALVQNAYATGEFEPAKDLLDLQNNFGCTLGRADSDNDSAEIKIKEEKDK